MISDFEADLRKDLEFDLSFNDFYEEFCMRNADFCSMFVLRDKDKRKIHIEDYEEYGCYGDVKRDIGYIGLKEKYRYRYDEDDNLGKKLLYKIPVPDFVIEAEFNGRKFYYNIYFDWDIDDKTVHLTSKKEIPEQLYRRYGKRICSDLLDLLSLYFICVCEHRDQHLEWNINIGWTGDEKYRYYKDVPLMRDEEENDSIIFRLRDEESHRLTENKMKCLLSVLKKSPQYIFIFAYGLLSVSLNARKEYTEQNKEFLKKNKDNEIYCIRPFNLCICGVNSGLTKKDIAMTFLGYCKVSEEHFRKNYTMLPYISSKKVEENIFKVCTYKDCPIIIYPSGNASDISSSSTAVTRIDRWRKKNIIKGFPVFISKRKMVNDNVINIDVTDAEDIKETTYKNMKGEEEEVSYIDISTCVDTIVYNFIRYLERTYSKTICKNDSDLPEIERLNKKSDRDKFDNCSEDYNELFSDSKYNLELACAYRDLLIALRQFSIFVKSTYPELSEKMYEIINQAKEIAKEEALDCEIKERRKPVKKEKTKVNKDAIREKFFDTVLKELERESAYIDESEEFLYIDYKEFQKCYEGDNYKQFMAICRDIHLIEVPRRASNGKFRGYAFDKMKDGKKYKVLKVYKKFYRDYCKAKKQNEKNT